MATRILNAWCEDHFHTMDPLVNAQGIHLWPFNPSFPVDVRYLTNGHTPKVRMNRHDYFEVLYLLSGTAKLRIQDRMLDLTPGDVSIIGSTLYHRVEADRDARFKQVALFFLPEIILGDGGPDSIGYLTPFLLQDARFPHVIPAQTGIPTKILALMQNIRTELQSDTPLARLAAKTHLKLLLLILAQRHSSYQGTVRIFERQQKALAHLQPLFSYVETHYTEQIRVREAARITGMSVSRFISFFKNSTGQSFIAYLNSYRVERAQHLLAHTDMPLTEIGHWVGFCDQSYFGMVFRRMIGVTPSSYRRQFCNNGTEPAVSSPGNTAIDPVALAS
jgi:AraC-like DNA-binding protein